jgi:flagellar biosynthesis/type III secretory pathway chaperone
MEHPMPIEDHVRELIAILRDLTGVYNGLLAAVVREREGLRRPRATTHRSAAAEKDTLRRRLQGLEDRRREQVEALARTCGCPAEEVTVTRLAALVPAAVRTELLRRRSELVEVTQRFRSENRRTELLLRHAGELLQSSYQVLKGLAARGGPVYHRRGELEGTRLHGKLVCSDI